MGRSPACWFTAGLPQPNRGSRVDAATPVPSVCICVHLWFQIVCFAACRTLPLARPSATRQPEAYAPESPATRCGTPPAFGRASVRGVAVYKSGMDREQVIATLRTQEQALRQRGVLHAGLFGSLARGEAKPTSDIDIVVELAPDAPIGLFEYVGITQYLSDLFPNRVDVANRRRLKPQVRPNVERDAVYAF
jgi:predicted nucleotidyltransferase